MRAWWCNLDCKPGDVLFPHKFAVARPAEHHIIDRSAVLSELNQRSEAILVLKTRHLAARDPSHSPTKAPTPLSSTPE